MGRVASGAPGHYHLGGVGSVPAYDSQSGMPLGPNTWSLKTFEVPCCIHRPYFPHLGTVSVPIMSIGGVWLMEWLIPTTVQS
jgi:hypothetical protein